MSAVNGQGAPSNTAVGDLGLPAALRGRAAHLIANAYRDELTGALMRRAGKEYLADEVQRAQRTGSGLAVAFVDVDGLKATNDTLGHAAGDALLVAVVKALSDSLRSYDRVVRYGGDEFVCVLPAGTATAVTAGVDRARHLLTAEHPGASFSSGVAALRPGESADALVRRADEALYAARADAARLGPASASAVGQPSSDPPSDDAAADIGCGHCGSRIPLTHFVLHNDRFVTRAADCASCGETTLIRLSTPLSFNESS
jgi:diguanylate cyclase (GGDEF)-like protein